MVLPTPGTALLSLSAVELDALVHLLDITTRPLDDDQADILAGHEEKRAPLVRVRVKAEKALEEGIAKHPSHFNFRRPSR